MNSIRCIHNKNGEITEEPGTCNDAHDHRRRATYPKNVCVQGRTQCRSTNSLVATAEHVRAKLNSCPPRMAYVKDGVQRLRKRAYRLLTNDVGESRTIEGRVCFVEGCTESMGEEISASSVSFTSQDDSAGIPRSWYSSCNGSSRRDWVCETSHCFHRAIAVALC